MDETLRMLGRERQADLEREAQKHRLARAAVPPGLVRNGRVTRPEGEGAKMKGSTYLRWLRRLVVLGAVVAGTTASTAGAAGQPPDVRDAALQVNTAVARPPDVQDAAAFSLVAAHSTAVSRPPDVAEAAQAAALAPVGQGSGFDWADYGIGIGSGIGLSLLLAGVLGTGMQQRRHRMQTT